MWNVYIAKFDHRFPPPSPFLRELLRSVNVSVLFFFFCAELSLVRINQAATLRKRETEGLAWAGQY